MIRRPTPTRAALAAIPTPVSITHFLVDGHPLRPAAKARLIRQAKIRTLPIVPAR